MLKESAPGKKISKAHVVIEYGKPIYPNDYQGKARKEKYKEIPEIITAMRASHKHILKQNQEEK